MLSKKLILSKLAKPSQRDFVSEALAAKKRRRKKLIIIGLLALLAAGWLVPVFSERLPDGIWHEADFELVRPELEKAIDDVRFNDGYDFSRYTLTVRTGFTTMRRTLLGNRFGRSGSSGNGYTYVVPVGLSFLEYDQTTHTAYLLPEYYDEFIEWCETESKNKQNKPDMATPSKPSD